MPSTVIRRWDYDPEVAVLRITFTSGEVYAYRDVPEEAVLALRAAFSKGRHFGRHIRDRYPCQRVTDDWVEEERRAAG